MFCSVDLPRRINFSILVCRVLLYDTYYRYRYIIFDERIANNWQNGTCSVYLFLRHSVISQSFFQHMRTKLQGHENYTLPFPPFRFVMLICNKFNWQQNKRKFHKFVHIFSDFIDSSSIFFM